MNEEETKVAESTAGIPEDMALDKVAQTLILIAKRLVAESGEKAQTSNEKTNE